MRVTLLGLLTIIAIDSFSFQIENKIVLINMDTANHYELALLIKKVDFLKPKVLALDITFEKSEDQYSDIAIMKAIWNSKNLVMPVGLENYTAEEKNYRLDDAMHLNKFVPFNVKKGFVEAILDSNEFKTLSRFSAFELVNNKIEKHFSLIVAENYNPLVQTKYLKGSKERVRKIDFKHGKRNFKIVHINDVIANTINKNLIKDKIVLIGYLGPEDIDRFYVSIDKGSGKVVVCELYGMEILANIVCQILDSTTK